MANVNELVKEIREGLTQTSASQKDEVRVMQAMLNDTEYEVGIYGKDGLKEKYSPAKDFRKMTASIVASTTKVSKDEAEQLVSKHEVTKNEAQIMVDISKEFTNTYLATGRKLPLGGREKSNFALSVKEVEESVKTYPKKTGINEDGSVRYETGKKSIPAHTSIKAYGSCPIWVK